MALVGLAMVLGGGGTVNPQTEMVLQVLTALILVPLVASARWQRGLGPVQGPALVLAGLILLVPVAQLVPVPPSIWQQLPGRAIEIQALALIQADTSWMPLTMSPARTFASLLATVCPLLLMLQVSRLSLRGRNWVLSVIVVVGVLSLALGVLQLSRTAGLDWSLYSHFSEGFLVGFQGNRNAEADILLAAMLATGALTTSRLGDGRNHLLTWTMLALAMLGFLVGLFMTGSRTGIALSSIALAFALLMLWPVLRKRSAVLYGLTGSCGVLVLSGGLLMQLQSVRKVVARFSLVGEARWDIWADTWYAIGQVWPFGSGIGTIVPMLEAAERLDVVKTARPVRAHNDWLEWTLETGLPGMIVLGLTLMFVGYLIVRAIKSTQRSDATASRRAQVLFAIGFLLIEALHAIVDYPMRSMSLATLTAVAVAMLLDYAATQQGKP
jgi:O-antigen ligase